MMDNSSFRVKSINIKINKSSTSRSLNSSEVYYGRSDVGVPFMWESEPGTPKIKYYDRPLPPLTPPPSFIYSSDNSKPLKKPTKSNLLNSFLPKLNLRRTSRTPISPVSSLDSSSSYRSLSHSVQASPITPSYRQGQGSPISTLCFGVRSWPRNGSSKTMKALLREIA